MPLRLRLAVRWHLTRCGACRTYVDQMRKLAALLGRSADRSLLPELAPELAERLARRAADGRGL
jgi:predicted anti-sigma-YlaC factor YlaD